MVVTAGDKVTRPEPSIYYSSLCVALELLYLCVPLLLAISQFFADIVTVSFIMICLYKHLAECCC